MFSPAASLRVLVAEDDYFIANDIARALEQAGAVVVGPTPSLPQAFGTLVDPSSVEIAVLDIRLGRDLVFPFADMLSRNGVPLIFFSAYDDLIIPDRFSDAIRVRKSSGVKELVDTVLDQRWRNAATSDLTGEFAFGVADLLPELRWRARQLMADTDAADILVERTLENALTAVEGGTWRGPTRQNLNSLLMEAYRRQRRFN